MSTTPKTEQGSGKPDMLRALYQQAVADDPGPSAQGSAAILARARQRVAAASQESARPQSQPAANERFWLRHALGGLAAVGLVGWLMLQHAAWWDGSDKGIGVEPDAQPAAVTESAAPVSASVSEAAPEAADAAPPVAAEPAPAASRATRQPSVAQKSKENRPAAHEHKAPAAMDMEARVTVPEPMPAPVQAQIREQAQESISAPASASATPPMAAPALSRAPSMERSARMAPSARARTSSAGEAVPPAAEKSLEAADAAMQAKLPLCPLVDETQGSNAAANGGAPQAEKSASGTALKPPNCRPRKAAEKRPVKPAHASEATEGVAQPLP